MLFLDPLEITTKPRKNIKIAHLTAVGKDNYGLGSIDLGFGATNLDPGHYNQYFGMSKSAFGKSF